MAYAMKGPARYVQGAGELQNLGRNAKQIGSFFYVLLSENGRRRFEETVSESFAGAEKQVSYGTFGGEATKEEVALHAGQCKDRGCDVVVGMGGGKVLDTAKAVAEELGLPCVIVPTVASNDAPCSGVAVLYNEAGVVVKALVTKRNPDLVLVDSAIIVRTPSRLFVAGMGDALATWFEARACQRSKSKTLARGQATQAAMTMARLCYDILITDGPRALEDFEKKEVTEVLDRVLEASILLSGIGFESGGLAVAHAINDALAHEPQAHDALHGEKVAFGVLVQLVLEQAEEAECKQVLTFMNAVGLPVTLEQLGIKKPSEAGLRNVADMACVPTQSTKNLSPDIQPEDVYQAIYRADDLGRQSQGI